MSFDEWMGYSKQISLVIFFVTFVAIVLWAYWPSNKQRFEQIGKGLLEDEEDPHNQG